MATVDPVRDTTITGGTRVVVLISAPKFADQLEAVVAKDGPEETPWRIIDDSELLSRDTRDRWRWTDSGQLFVAGAELAGGVGASE